MQMILNDDEAKEYLRLKAIFNADTDLDLFEDNLEYFYFTRLVPVHERVDLKRYPVKSKITEDVAEDTIRKKAETLLKMVEELRAKLKLLQNNNKE